MSMNINLLRNAVIEGQIATLTAQKVTWGIYADRTGEDITTITAQIDKHIEALKKLLVTVP